MRTAILTDVHANLEALRAVLEEVGNAGVDRIVCLGDVVGYGADPEAVCDLVRARSAFTLLGNHDAAATGRMDADWYHPAARAALEWTRARLSPANLAWLRGLDYTQREGAVLWSHGAPDAPDRFEYVYTVEAAGERAGAEGLGEINFFGHSHLGRAFALTARGAEDRFAARVPLGGGEVFLISVPSCGQPRDFDPRAGWAIFDDAARSVEFRRTPYPIEAAARKILAAGLEPHFAERLRSGT